MEKSDTQPHVLTKNSIRLFGKEFGASHPTIIIIDDSSSSAATTTTTTVIHHITKEKKQSQRHFECHYCNRKFPTSQALGGHQNAHRRERLLAKRTHIQSVPYYHNHPHTATASPPYHHHIITSRIINYNNNAKFYGDKASSTSNQAPIYGSPMFGSRFPTAVQKLATFNHSALLTYSNTDSSSRGLYMHESKPSFNDQVSLDLHL